MSRPSSFPLSPVRIGLLTLSGLVATSTPLWADIQQGTDTKATLSNTNFTQTDADALQNQLDALTAELATNRTALSKLSLSDTTYAALKRTIDQQEATKLALQAIIVQLRAGKTVSHYSVKTEADGAVTLTVTYTDTTTTVANIPGDLPTATTDTDTGSDTTDTSQTGSGNSSSGGSGSNIANILNSLMGQLLGGGMGAGLGNGLGGISGLNPTGAGNGAANSYVPQHTTTPATATETTPTPDCKPRATTDTAPGKKADDDINAAGKTTQGSGTTDTELGKAADDDINANGSTAKYQENKTAADKKKQEEQDKLPYCDPPQVNTPNPESTGGTDTGALNGSKITSEEQARQLLNRYINDGKSSAKNAMECASLTKALSNLGRTPTWYKGEQVYGNTNLAIGTPIATFCNGNNYGVGKSGCSHTGIYLGQNAQGVRILHQWNKSGGARIDTLPWKAWGRSGNEGGLKYYTIRNGNAFLGIPWYLPSLLAGYTLPLQGEGLALSFTLPYTQLQPQS